MNNITLKIPYLELKKRHEVLREQQTEHDAIRLHRAISWLKHIDSLTSVDLIFIQLWISFNAAYAGNVDDLISERTKLKQFLHKMIELDTGQQIYHTLFNKYSGPIRTLIDNKFAFDPFWQAVRTHDSSELWKKQFKAHREMALKVILDGNASALLSIIFDRIYTLRNQLIHGGATCESSFNRTQLLDAVNILSDIVPLILLIMISHPNIDFGEIAYPIIR